MNAKLLYQVKEDVNWIIRDYEHCHCIPPTDSKKLKNILSDIDDNTFQISNNNDLTNLSKIINNIIVWCDTSGNFTINELELTEPNDFIECITSLYDDISLIKNSSYDDDDDDDVDDDYKLEQEYSYQY